MILEAMEFFAGKIEEAKGARDKVRLMEVPGDKERILLVDAAGTHQFIDRPRPDRRHRLDTIEAFVDYVAWARGEFDCSPTVWFDRREIHAVLDDDGESYRRDHVTCELAPTKTWERVATLENDWLPQKAFVRLLRIQLADAATESSQQLLRVARVLAFSESQAGHGKIELGRQSLGRDIENEVKSEAGDVPETITLNVRIYDDPSTTLRRELPLAVDINPREGAFNLTPIPGAIEEAEEDQIAAIVARLRNGLPDVPVFQGEP